MRTRTTKEDVLGFFNRIDPPVSVILKEIDFNDWFTEISRDEGVLFRDLCNTIIGQQLAGNAARSISSRFEAYLEHKITPNNVLKHDAEAYRGLGLSWAKARSVLDLAEKTATASLDLTNLFNLEDEEVIRRLSQVKGIGRWTAEMFMMFRMGNEDVFSFGDLGLRRGFELLVGNSLVTDAEILKRVENWSPYRSYGSIAMWHLNDSTKSRQKK